MPAATSSGTWPPGNRKASKPWSWSVRQLTFHRRRGPIMSRYVESLPAEQRVVLRRHHSGGEPQARALLESTKSFATSYDDMYFTPPYLSTIQARTLIVHGDRDPLYPVELSVEMARAMPQSQLWILAMAAMGLSFEKNGPTFRRRLWPSYANDSISRPAGVSMVPPRLMFSRECAW